MALNLPTIFISHGAPTFALHAGEAGAALTAFAQGLPALKAVLIVSPHWSTSAWTVTSGAQQTAWHDFRGFPQALYTLRYDPPGAPWLADRVMTLAAEHGLAVQADAHRPLDHGAWVPLRWMLPNADVPVVQLSLRPQLTPREQLMIGAALRPLREEGVLIIGSGGLTHNLNEFDPSLTETPPYIEAFRTWMIERLTSNDREALIEYRLRAPFAERAHPTDEHLLPLFIAIGAAGDSASVERLTDEVAYGTLAMDSFAFYDNA